jgi:hypothetical protein
LRLQEETGEHPGQGDEKDMRGHISPGEEVTISIMGMSMMEVAISIGFR